MKPRNEPSKSSAAGGRKAALGAAGKAQPSAASGRRPGGRAGAWLLGVGLVMAGLSAFWLVSHRQHATDGSNPVAGVAKQDGAAETIESLERALQANPNDPKTCERLGNLLVESGRVTEALGYLQKAVELEPNNPTAHYNLGVALFELGRVDEAITQYQKDLALNPRDALAHGNLGNALLAKKRVDEALNEYSHAVALMPTNALAHAAFANALLQKGELDHAVDEFEQALHLQPDFPPAKSRLLLIGWIWATSPNDGYRNGILALRLAQELQQMSDRKDPYTLRILAAAYAEVGSYSEAVSSATQALQIATAQTNAELAADLRKQLGYYQSERPFRDVDETNQVPGP